MTDALERELRILDTERPLPQALYGRLEAALLEDAEARAGGDGTQHHDDDVELRAVRQKRGRTRSGGRSGPVRGHLATQRRTGGPGSGDGGHRFSSDLDRGSFVGPTTGRDDRDADRLRI